jgi:lipopolysaccharide transport system ATP-binding protein
MGSIMQLCDRAIHMNDGQVVNDGVPSTVISAYMAQGIVQGGERVWVNGSRLSFDDKVYLHSIRLLDHVGAVRTVFDVKESVIVEINYSIAVQKHVLNLLLTFRNETGQAIFSSLDNLDSPWQEVPQPVGLYQARCTIPANLLNESYITVECTICTRPTSDLNLTTEQDALIFQVTDDRTPGGVRGNWVREWPPSIIRPRFHWDWQS